MSGTLERFRARGFDYAVVVGLSGVDIQYSGDPHTDAYNLSEYLSDNMDMPYYVTIPFFTPSMEPRENITGSFEWINTFAGSSDPNLRGFYWSLENAWIFEQDQIDIRRGISHELIQAMSERIHEYGFEFIWIPSACTMKLDGTNIFPLGSYPGAYEFFDYIFVQPNYYLSKGKNVFSDYSDLENYLRKLQRLKSTYYAWNVYLEMEADECVIGGGGNCRTCYGPDNCTKLAGDYIRAQINVVGRKYPQRAYYFGVTFDVIDNSHCIENSGVTYV